MVWHKPLLSTYSDNYRYGSSLYDTSVTEAEKLYRNTLAKTPVRSDRGDLGLYSFAGHHVHGGTPAKGTGVSFSKTSSSSTATTTKSTTSDLYAPMSFGYGREYYNNLRADYQKPKAKSSSSRAEYTVFPDEMAASGADIKTHSAKTTSSYDDTKKTITTTTTTERWVPLSSYLYSYYPSYYYSYSSVPRTTTTSKTTDDVYYSDDYYKSTSTSRSRNLEALDLNVSSSSMDRFDHNLWMEKCRDIQCHLDQVNRWVAEAEAKIKTDVVGARNKMQAELAELTLVVDDTAKYNDELQMVIKRQAKQIKNLNSQYDDINRHLAEVNDTLEKSRVRCQTLSGELANVQTAFEMGMKRK